MVKHQAEQADKQETGVKMPALRNKKFHSRKGLIKIQDKSHRLCPAIPTALKEPEQKFASNCKVLRQTREQIAVAVLRQPQKPKFLLLMLEQPKATLEQHLQLALPEVVPQL